MYGGLKKSVSLVALVAAAGMMTTSANAADLGGDCCADLEERVAELEATTVKKGNRRVSLTISGQVNRATMYYNDGNKSNTFFGLDNTNSSTRFQFDGSAKVTPTVSAGFRIQIDVADTGRSAVVNQVNEDGSSARGGNVTALPFRNNTNADHLLRVRNAFWYVQSSQLGEIRVGRLSTSGSQGVLDLGGISVIAATGEGCIGTGLGFRNSATGLLSGRTITSYSMGCAHPTVRTEGVQYVSPTFAGFTFSASVGEAANVQSSVDNDTLSRREALGRNYAADLRYAGEFSGVRVAAGIGYEDSDKNDDDGVSYNSRFQQWGGSLSLLHVPTGLFAQGYYTEAQSKPYDVTGSGGSTISSTGVVAAVPASATAGQFGASTTSTLWQVQAGIRQNWFGIGNTSLYGEYVRAEGWARAQTATFANGVTTFAASGDKMDIWGVGAVQNIDAAAMELYLGYRNYRPTETGLALKPIDVIAAGARIRF